VPRDTIIQNVLAYFAMVLARLLCCAAGAGAGALLCCPEAIVPCDKNPVKALIGVHVV
jgi:hypothetical protein